MAPQARTLRDALRRLIVAHGALEDAKRPCGAPLSAPHAWALLELQDAGPLTVTALAERLNIDRTNVSRLCARMASEGQVAHLAHPHDGRARLVELTPKGARLAATVDHTSTAHFARVLGQLHTDQDALIAALHALTQAIHATPSTQDPA